MKTKVNIKRFPLKAADKTAISIEIENIKNSCDAYSYMDSILLWAEVNDIGPEDMGKCINSTLKEKFEQEAKSAKLIKSESASSSRSLDQRLFGI